MMSVRAFARAHIPVEVRRRIRQTQNGVRARLFIRSSDLDALGIYYGTDKNSKCHNYTPLYEWHLGRRRRQIRTVLEIGVGGWSPTTEYENSQGGESLRMWRRYFPNATIVGIDIHYKSVAGHRICFEKGDQSDSQFLGAVASRYGPFDLVIDDGSHMASDVQASFEHLWHAVKPGGFYVIEDISVSYSETWGGGPPGTPGTAADLIKQLVDSTLHRYPSYDPLPTIEQMHVYNEIVFLQRPHNRPSGKP